MINEAICEEILAALDFVQAQEGMEASPHTQ